ncbi:MAG: PIN domain-containing protein [Deltaproteobacteria bacterium]|nr:PIN domain-containing protein [Deltaproteobacteria bacterium]
MIVSPFVVVLDANVLFPFALRDTLFRAAESGLYSARWSDEILAETSRNLVKRRKLEPLQAARLVAQIDAAFPEAKIAVPNALINGMQNDPGDRHVAAAAVVAGAQVIVTINVRHFRQLPDGIEAQHPDEFLCHLVGLAPGLFPQLIAAQAAALRKPPYARDQLLDCLAKVVPKFVSEVRAEITSAVNPAFSVKF